MSASCSIAPRLAEVGELGTLVRAALRVAVELRDGDHRDLELLAQELERPADLGDLLLAVVVATVARHQLQVVDDDQPEAVPARLEPPRLRPDVDDRDVARVDDEHRRVVQVLRRLDDPGPLLGLRAAPRGPCPTARGPRRTAAACRSPSGSSPGRTSGPGSPVPSCVPSPTPTLRARFVTNDDLPTPGRAATTIRLPGWSPDRRLSRSMNPVGTPANADSRWWMCSSWSMLSSTSVRTGDELFLLVLARDRVDEPLGLVGRPPRVLGDRVRARHDLRGGVDQPAQQRVVGDDLGVVAGAPGRRHGLDQVVDVERAAGRLELAAPRRAPRRSVIASTGSPRAYIARIAWKIFWCTGR